MADFPVLATGIPEGDLLPDWDDVWLTDERTRLHQLRLHLLETLTDHLAASGQFGLAVEVALSLRAPTRFARALIGPWSESTWLRATSMRLVAPTRHASRSSIEN